MKNKEILNTAKLVQIPLEPMEEKEMLQQFGNILQYIQQLEQVDTQNVSTTLQSEPACECQQERQANSIKIPGNTLAIEKTLSNTPYKEENFFIISNLFTDA